MPRFAGILRFCEIGNIHLAAKILSPIIIIAPSCNGLFLKNIVSISTVVVLALIISPVSANNCKAEFLAITINAPVLLFDIFTHALAIAFVFTFGTISRVANKSTLNGKPRDEGDSVLSGHCTDHHFSRPLLFWPRKERRIICMSAQEPDMTYKGRKPSKKVREQWQREAMQLIRQANSHHDQAATLFVSALNHAKQAGEALREARRRALGKRWTRFSHEHFNGSQETARVYMRIAKYWDDPRIVGARSGSMKPLSIEGFLAIIRGKRLNASGVQGRKPTNDQEAEAVYQQIRKEFAACLRSLKYEEAELLEESFPYFWDRMYEPLKERVLMVYEQDAASIGNVYRDELKEMEEMKRTRYRGKGRAR